MGARYEDVATIDAFTTSANTDIIADYTIQNDGILHIGVETVDTSDVRITLNTTNFTTLIDTAADIWQFLEIPVRAGDVFNIQTVGIEVISFRIIMEF